MSKYKVYEYWQGLPGWAKGLIAVGGIAIGWFGVVQPIRKSLAKHKDLEGARKEQDSAKTDLAALSKKGIVPSYPASQFDTWANELQNQYSGCDPLLQSGISTGKIFKLLNNDADFLALSQAWGIRTCKGCLWENNFEGSFSQAIAWETMGVTRDALNLQLKANGITYRV